MRAIGSIILLCVISTKMEAVMHKKDACIKRFGQIYCENQQVYQLNKSGIIYMKDMKVDDSCQLRGKISISRSYFNKLVVYGQLSMDATTLEGMTRIYGSANINYTMAKDTLWLWSNNITMLATQVQADVVVNGEIGQVCRLSLRENTKIMGDIVFKGCKGIVELRSEACVHGAIIDGKVIQL